MERTKLPKPKMTWQKIVRERNRLKEKIQASKPMAKTKDQEPASTAIVTAKAAEPPPETPAPLPKDLFSPVSSEPSAARAESCDTPPPPDLGPDTGTGSFGRASRRPRGTVNYAQPNLRDKMRRPTKDLVDAVGAEERLRQVNLRTEGGESSSVVIKQEEIADVLPVWKTIDPKEIQRVREEPASPLSNKTGGSAMDLPGSVITERRRRSVLPACNGDTSDPGKPSGAASAIAALTAGSHRAKRREEDKTSADTIGEDKTHEPVERPSIYDFTESSPDPGGYSSDKDLVEKSSKSMRSSRRHSSVPASSEQGPGSLSISRRGERRRESLLGGRREGGGQGDEQQISRTKSVLEIGAGTEDVALGRGERAANRRRSMML
ncbi:hypothetical protein ABVK25_008031 [Lepraria finkii]|uniref:Shugoshin C-terminal domain-containing protein n=1 Tax=Lepraria finkii TaxID=1340010 RepID=A0ABR4B2Y4_9LECA